MFFPCRARTYRIVDSGAGQLCFYCGEPTHNPAVHWSGMTGFEIYLHPACALDLSIRILRDVHEIKNPMYYERLRGKP